MKKTPLFPLYSEYPGVKIIEFGGWEMPVNFSSGIIAEHTAVRNNAGLFDVSHMGEIVIAGPEAEAYVDYLVTNDVTKISDGEVLYSPMCYPDGTVVDDLIIYRMRSDHFFIVVNAGNIEKDFLWMTEENPKAAGGAVPEGLSIENLSASFCQLAVQGPKAEQIVTELYSDAPAVGFFTFHDKVALLGCEVLISRTGYTGEDGFEIYTSPEAAVVLWDKILEIGGPFGLLPCGLGARDTLRLEAKLPLYGHEISDRITPLEANLSIFVELEGADFCGKDALVKQIAEGIPRTIRGVKMVDKGVARQGYPVFLEGEEEPVGVVTSGAVSPLRNEFIALVLMERGTGKKFGDALEIEIHRKRKKAVLVRTPFFKKRTLQH